jgi:cyclic pyranopterin phosphate synthase
MKDSFGRSIRYLRLSVTDRCNLRCRYCMPAGGVEKLTHNDILRFEELEKVARTFVELGVTKIRLTGGEPLARKGIVFLAAMIRRIEGLQTLAITTNGTLLSPLAAELRAAGVNRVNVSLDTLDERRFWLITRGGELRDALSGIEAALSAGFDRVRINCVLMGGWNEEDIPKLAEWTKRGADVRFIELMPEGPASAWATRRFLPASRVLEMLHGLEYIGRAEESSPAEYWRIPGAEGKIGLIRALSAKFCADCDRARVTADGRLLWCLHSDRGVDLRAVLREGGNLRQAIVGSVGDKPPSHDLSGGHHTGRGPSQIGG